MSKINAVRLINVNYNNDAIRISDEVFHLNGESTLVSLRNGGGKSVLVQMITAPFVHKRYRDAKDRPFESYFTTSKPSFILVEWALDQCAGYVLTGMMVRKSQDMGEDTGENLEMINFISEYQGPCVQDIHHLPVVEKGKKEMVLKNFSVCRQLFEAYKKDRSVDFNYYDMANAAQSRQYFQKLREYQINDKEWETIIKKVNLKESGLSDLFADCKDEKGLVEKWFLDAVESKLNKDKNRIAEFQSILSKYVGQYKDNESKIKRRDTIRIFKEESQKIEEKARLCQEASLREAEQENLIINFIEELNRLKEETETGHRDICAQIGEIKEAILRVEYEKLSAEIYELLDRQRFHTSNRDMIAMERDSLERDALAVEETLHILACARQQESVDENKRELDIIRQQLRLSRKKDEDLEPERHMLGYALKCTYEEAMTVNERRQKDTGEALQKTDSDIAVEQEKLTSFEQALRDAARKEGALRTGIEAYDRQEEDFAARYREELVRNIMGEYEPGSLEIRRDDYRQRLEEIIRGRAGKKKQLERAKEAYKGLERKLQDMRSAQVKEKALKEQAERLKEEFDGELNKRQVILKYLDISDADIFDLHKILKTSGRKLLEIENLRRNLEKEEDELNKEYARLTQGKVLELPEEFETQLENLGIHTVYGMEWLKKNGYSEEENRRLLRSHPFLPYALILSRQELLKLSQHTGEVYTSFPIPMILRESLGKKAEGTPGAVVKVEDLSFYVLFNENLLNEDKLRQIIEEKERQIGKKREAIAVRKTEYEEYFQRQELIKNQKVTKEGYENNEEQRQKLAHEIERLDAELQKTSQEMSALKEETEDLEGLIRKAETDAQYQKRKLEDYGLLCKQYEEYVNHRKELERCRRDQERLEEKKSLSQAQCEKLKERFKSLETQRDCLVSEGERLSECIQRYQEYDESGHTAGDVAGRTLEELEARYAAITSYISRELKELTEREQRAARRYAEAEGQLAHLKNKYRLSEEAWSGVHYSRKEESHQEILLEDKRMKIEGRRTLWNEEDKNLAVIARQIEERRQRLISECREEEPLPREHIKDQDFDARKNQLIHQQKQAQRQADIKMEQIHSCDENLTALSEYTQFALTQRVTWEEDIAQMDSQALRNYKGILIRDYNQRVRDTQGAREQLTQVLNQVVRREDFQEDFYRRPLESMIGLTADAVQVLRQLETTIQSYDSLMEKLAVDISVVEKEKERMIDLLEDYVREIHKNLARIDRNSTITIRERPVKMLKIEVPQWEENESLYRMRLEDFVDEATQKGLSIFESNENAQEYFGTRVTTRSLYDTVVGIGNVQIRLYKIEEQREYPITWAQVAKNSGGEGFLSAFVILSSLLYYMRKDESDIFADRNEGKVLLMDNPFAQTNAAHLLKPLMDMAQKTNTQLICLTGLGGESIYNRFDNIYVLNLIAASLKNGMQYLKADHLRGEEPETMVASQIEVVEQQELVF